MTNLHYIVLRLLKILALLILVLVLAIAGFLVYLGVTWSTPLQLPAPTGPYPVGRTEFDWVDASRPDPLANEGDAPRELVVWVWYPAGEHGATPAPYLPPAWARARKQAQGVGIFVERDPTRIISNAYDRVPLATGTFPVLVMEPGLGPMATDYTVFAENLASHGYFVVGINPTYSANLTVFPDGRVVHTSARGTIPDNSSAAALSADISRIAGVWAQDEIFVMDRLAVLNADRTSFLAGHLDLNRIGVWGHSLGGATAGIVCRQDPRCKAGVNIDGHPADSVVGTPMPRPLMFITEDYTKSCDESCEAMHQGFLDTAPGAAFAINIAHTRHFDFSDLPLRWLPALRPLFRLAGYEGTIRPARALQVTNAYLLAFFDQTLKGEASALLRRPSPIYSEVTLERR